MLRTKTLASLFTASFNLFSARANLCCNATRGFTPLLKRHKKRHSKLSVFFCGAFSRTRTYDPAVNSRMLYRLSYKGSQRDYYINICRASCQEFFIKNKLNFYVYYLLSLSSEIALRSFSSCSFISSFLDFTP